MFFINTHVDSILLGIMGLQFLSLFLALSPKNSFIDSVRLVIRGSEGNNGRFTVCSDCILGDSTHLLCCRRARIRVVHGGYSEVHRMAIRDTVRDIIASEVLVLAAIFYILITFTMLWMRTKQDFLLGEDRLPSSIGYGRTGNGSSRTHIMAENLGCMQKELSMEDEALAEARRARNIS